MRVPTFESIYDGMDEAYERDRQEMVDMDNTPADIYANIRNKALEDAAHACEVNAKAAAAFGDDRRHSAAIADSIVIRALKTQEAA